jgi:hypothetical protein
MYCQVVMMGAKGTHNPDNILRASFCPTFFCLLGFKWDGPRVESALPWLKSASRK